MELFANHTEVLLTSPKYIIQNLCPRSRSYVKNLLLGFPSLTLLLDFLPTLSHPSTLKETRQTLPLSPNNIADTIDYAGLSSVFLVSVEKVVESRLLQVTNSFVGDCRACRCRLSPCYPVRQARRSRSSVKGDILWILVSSSHICNFAEEFVLALLFRVIVLFTYGVCIRWLRLS